MATRRKRNEPEVIMHSEYSKELRIPALACLATSESRTKTPVPPPVLSGRGWSRSRYPVGVAAILIGTF